MNIKIKIKHFNTQEERLDAYKQAEKLGLDAFSALSPNRNEGRPPEGWHTLDLSHVFSNQYNTDKFRVFELHDPLTVGPRGSCVPTCYGYYIEQGIDAIRAYQSKLSVCGYCGVQYHNTKEKYCLKCVGSEYLTEKDYSLLVLRNIRAKNCPTVKLPPEMIQLINDEQKKSRTAKLIKQKAEKLRRLEQDIADAETEHKAFKWLIDRDMDFENVIYYSHTKQFCFGWRNPIGSTDAISLKKKLKGFPYTFDVKTN